MDVKIGVTDTGRELVVSSTSNPDEIEALISESLKNPLGTLVLVDEKGRRVIVPSARIAYVEIAPADGRRVGFALRPDGPQPDSGPAGPDDRSWRGNREIPRHIRFDSSSIASARGTCRATAGQPVPAR